MELGIFAKVLPRPTLEETLVAASSWGLKHLQFNFSVVGLPTLPESLELDRCIEIARAFRERSAVIAAVSGTFNILDPAEWTAREPHRLETLAASCRWLDTRIITLCSGTLDREDMWRWHPNNIRRSSWNTLRKEMLRIADIADRYEVTMAIEPEMGNVVNSAIKARMLLDDIGSPWIKLVADPANLFRIEDLGRMDEVLDEAFEWIGDDIVLAHAKEIDDRARFGTLAPGQGVLDWDRYLAWLGRIEYRGPLIIHGFHEDRLAPAVGFLRSKLKKNRPRP